MNKTCVVLLLLLSCLSKTFTARSQSKIFYDTLTSITGNGYMESAFMKDGYIYASGTAFTDSGVSAAIPAIYKIDTLGNTVWTSIDPTDYDRLVNSFLSMVST